jgi:hypothetical protein
MVVIIRVDKNGDANLESKVESPVQFVVSSYKWRQKCCHICTNETAFDFSKIFKKFPGHIVTRFIEKGVGNEEKGTQKDCF